jgi:biotin carboxylase
MRKTVMFIGAGRFQEAGIRMAKEMGLRVIATDGDSQAPGFRFADLAFSCDVKDLEGQLRIARKNHIDGVLSIASDVSLSAVAYVATAMSLPGIDGDTVEKCTDKALMRKAFYEHDVPSPQSIAVENEEHAFNAAQHIGFPVVIKPADNAGSRGVRYVRDAKEVAEAYTAALGYSRKKKVLVEDFMEGVEVSIEAFVVNKQMQVLTLSDKVRTPPPYLLDIDVIFPSAYPQELQQKIIAIAEKAIRAVGINMGPVHMELMMTKEGPIPVELAARGAGFKVFSDIVPIITGIDLLKASIDMALGYPVDLKRCRNLGAAIKFFSAKCDGQLNGINGIEKVKAMKDVYDLEFYYSSGDKVKALTSGSDRIGHIITIGENRKAALHVMAEAVKLLKIEVEPE